MSPGGREMATSGGEWEDTGPGLLTVTALPPSQGNTMVLTVVDRFSKVTHFIPLPSFCQGDSGYCH